MNEKKIYAVMFCIVLTIVTIYMLKANKKKTKVSRFLVEAMNWSIVAIICNIIMLCSNTYAMNVFFYSLYFVCIEWILYSLLKFAWVYTYLDYFKHKVFKIIFQIILIADSISMMLNTVFGHAIEYEQKYVGKSLYLIIHSKLPYQIHLFLCYVMCGFFALYFIKKVYQSPSIYKRKYLLPLLELGVIVVMDGIFLKFHLMVDFAILFYAIAAVILYRTVFTYQPRHLMIKTMSLAMEAINDAFLIFDIDGENIWQNQVSIDLIGQVSNLAAFCSLVHINIRSIQFSNNHLQITLKEGKGKRQFELRYHKMEDDKRRYMGYFFLLRDITEEIKYIRKQEFLAHYDQLTGIYNKYYFYEKVKDTLMNKPNESYYLLVSDIGRFKTVNDIFGTAVGDKIIIRIAEQIRKTVPRDSIYARLESDKFAVLIKKSNFDEKVFIESSNKILTLRDVSLPVKQYLGVYEIMDKSLSINIMCDRAILALNTIKGNYNKTIAYYDNNYYIEINHEQEIIGEFHSALERKDFILYLQPQVNHDTGEVAGAEALVRWVHPDKGMITPNDFIPILEKNGLIAQLDEYVWNEACMILKKWKEDGYTERTISINISQKDLFLIDVYQTLVQLTRKYNIKPSSIKLEITETSLMNDVERQVELIENLQTLGFKIEMDDFGSGYSSLNMLKDIPVDILKMDMKFFQYTENISKNTDILRTVIELAHRLKLPVIAEGVEVKEQADFLSSIGCRYIQGYLYAKPMPLHEFENFILVHPYKDIE